MEISIKVLIIKFHSVFSICSTFSLTTNRSVWWREKNNATVQHVYSEPIRPRNVDRCSSNDNTEHSDLVSIRIAVLNHDFVFLLLLVLLLLLCSSPIFHINYIQLNIRICVWVYLRLCICVLQIYRAILWIEWKSWREQFLLEYSLKTILSDLYLNILIRNHFHSETFHHYSSVFTALRRQEYVNIWKF